MTKRMKDDLKDIVLFFFATLLIAVCTGCMSENTGMRLTIGDSAVLPQISTADGELSLNIYETIGGMNFITRKDCLVTFNYAEAHTNRYFGVVETVGYKKVTGKVEPLEVGGAASCRTESSETTTCAD